MLGEKLNIGEFAGGLLLSLIFMSMWIFPLLFAKSSKILIASLFIGVASMSCCIAFGWLPVWLLVVVVLLIALGFGDKIKNAIK